MLFVEEEEAEEQIDLASVSEDVVVANCTMDASSSLSLLLFSPSVSATTLAHGHTAFFFSPSPSIKTHFFLTSLNTRPSSHVYRNVS